MLFNSLSLAVEWGLFNVEQKVLKYFMKNEGIEDINKVGILLKRVDFDVFKRRVTIYYEIEVDETTPEDETPVNAIYTAIVTITEKGIDIHYHLL